MPNDLQGVLKRLQEHAPIASVALESTYNYYWLADGINRQFTQRGLEQWLELDLRKFGYRFYQTPAERRQALERIRRKLAERSVGD